MLLLVGVLFAVGPVCGGQSTPGEAGTLMEEWHSIYVNGQKSGYQQYLVRRLGEEVEGRYETRVSQKFAVRRGSAELRFRIEKSVREDEEGHLVSFKLKMIQGPLRQATQGEVSDGQLHVRTGGTGGATVMPAPDGLCPWAVHRLRLEKGFEPGTQYSYTEFTPEFPAQEAVAACTVGPTEEVRIGEKPRELHRLTYTVSIMPGMEITEWVDDSNTTWLSRAMAGPGLQLEFRRTDRGEALRGAAPADVLLHSIVTPDRPISGPRRLERLRVLMVPSGPGIELPDLPSDPYQSVESTEEGLKITIRRAHPSPDGGYALPYGGREYVGLLRANRWMETADPLIVRMSREAVGDATEAITAARRIARYVERTVTQKNLSFGMATAAETAQSRTGDCTEHAVLTAALARAAGMPSRVVEGLAYVEEWPGVGGTFGYHMWTEVYVGEWLPLDAALGGHDATHIALGRSDLNGPDSVIGVQAILPFLGRFNIRVLGASPQAGGTGL
jgi:hypothetical protein